MNIQSVTSKVLSAPGIRIAVKYGGLEMLTAATKKIEKNIPEIVDSCPGITEDELVELLIYTFITL